MSITTSPSLNQAAAPSFDRAVADLKSGAAMATSAYAQASEKAAKTGADVRAFSKDMLEAFVQAGQVAATESQILFRDMLASGQTAVTESLVNLRALLAAKTVKEQLELQTTFARTTAIRAVSETSRFALAYIDLTEKAFAPVATRAYAAADKFATLKA